MKKLLTILGAVGLITTAGTSVVACGPTNNDDSLSRLTANELQKKLDKNVKDFKEYMKNLEDPQNPSEDEIKKGISMIFDIYCFYAKVFLETEYIIVNIAEPGDPEFASEILEATDEQEYQACLKTMIMLLKDWTGEDASPYVPQSYKETLKKYKIKLEEKLNLE